MKRTVLSCLLLVCCLICAGCGGPSNANSQANAANHAATPGAGDGPRRGDGDGANARGGLPTATVACRFSGRIYRNKLTKDVAVTVQFTDTCAGAISEIDVLDKDARSVANLIESINDGESVVFTFPVPAQGALKFTCQGETGGCSYTILSVMVL